jgi:cyclopropane-fatty-acyl-phospholipid synthase
MGRAYVEGDIDLEGKIQDIIDVAHKLTNSGLSDESPGLVQRMASRLATAVSHTKTKDKQAIQYHYDVSNEFYAQWLDPNMVYSCAYFERGDETLEQAQIKKLDHIMTKLRIGPGQRLLDIGCGWGALVLRAAQRYGAQCLGITLSQNQFNLATQRVKDAGLEDKIEIRMQDYRDVKGSFDRITSIGMFEHVGFKNLSSYFKIIHDLLTPNGWALNHGITSTDPWNRELKSGGGRFINQYVFPEGELPHIGTVLTSIQEGLLEVIDVEGLRRHYARTLQYWSDTFEAKSETIRKLVDEKRWRIWRLYLLGSQWVFEHDNVSVFQILCHRQGQSAQTLPWSRAWMYDKQNSI